MTYRDNVITVFELIPFMMVVVGCWFIAYAAKKIRGFRHPFESHSLVDQCSCPNFLRATFPFLLVSSLCYFRSFLRVSFNPFNGVLNTFLSVFRVSIPPFVVFSPVFTLALSAMRLSPSKSAFAFIERIKSFDLATFTALFFSHVVENILNRLKCKHFEATT